MGNTYNNYVGIAVENVWTLVRDVFNIAFIFGIIYIGFKIILSSDDSGSRRSLGLLIAAALLINFSLFFSKAVVDFSNLAAVQFRTLVTTIDTGGAAATQNGTDTGFLGAPVRENQIAAGFVSIVNPQTLFAADSNSEGVPWVSIFGSFIFLLITAFVLFSAAILFTVRFVALLILMAVSPILFLGWIIPAFQSISQTYWKMLLRYSFVAPAYMFMLVLALNVMTRLSSASNLKSGNGLGDVTDPEILARAEPDTLTILSFYAVSIGLMLAANTVANKMGVAGSETVLKMGKSLRGVAYRNTGGRISAGARNIFKNIDRQLAADEAKDSQRSWLNRNLGRGLLREVSRQAVITGQDSAQAGVDYGAGGRSLTQARADRKKQNEAMSQAQREVTTAEKIRKGLAAEVKFRNDPTSLNADEKKSLDAFRSSVPSMGIKDIEALDASQRRAIAPLLSSKQFEKIDESTSISQPEKDALVELATEAVVNEYKKTKLDSTTGFAETVKYTDSTGTDVDALEIDPATGGFTSSRRKATKREKNLSDITDSQLEMLGVDELVKPENAIRLNAEAIKRIEKVFGTVRSDDVEKIKKARKETTIMLAKNPKGAIGGVNIRDLINNQKVEDVAGLPDEVFEEKSLITEGVYNHLFPTIVEKKLASPFKGNIKELRDNIDSAISKDPGIKNQWIVAYGRGSGLLQKLQLTDPDVTAATP